jgi:hypothetical protein
VICRNRGVDCVLGDRNGLRLPSPPMWTVPWTHRSRLPLGSHARVFPLAHKDS